MLKQADQDELTDFSSGESDSEQEKYTSGTESSSEDSDTSKREKKRKKALPSSSMYIFS